MNAIHPIDDLAALALDALDAPRRADVLAHLESCSECARLEREYREAATGLAEVLPPTEPSPLLRERLLAAVRRDLESDDAAGAEPPPPRPLPRRRRRSVHPRWLIAAAVALVTFGWAVFLQIQVNALGAENARLRAEADRYRGVVGVLSARAFEARELAADDQNGAWGRVYYQADAGRGMLTVEQLPPPPPGMAYQVWLVRRDGGRVSAGLFRTNDNGWAYVLLQSDQPFGDFQRVGITTEPDQGSPGPTGKRVLGAAL